MKLTKSAVIETLKKITVPGEGKNMVDSDAVQNINIFGDELIVDLQINNPSLQAKKKSEVEVMRIVHQEIDPKIKVQVNIQVNAPEPTPQIKGKEIKGIHNIIAIASGKGGVGKSTVAVNIAITLQKMGFSVGILDADVYGPSIPTMLDAVNEKPLSVKENGISKMKPIENYGIKMLSLGFFTQPSQAVIWRGPMASKALNQMIFDGAWGKLDFLILDLPPGTGDIHLSMMQSLPITGAVIVSTPQQVALADARKGIAMFQQKGINIPILGLIENMAYFTPKELPDNKYYIFGRDGAKLLAENLDVPLLGEIPIEQSIREGADIGVPAALQKKSDISGNLTVIVKNMITELLDRNKNIPPSEVIKITNMSGCSAIKK